MDRNFCVVYVLYEATVALRKESVDRNFCSQSCFFIDNVVALRKESVDRNANIERKIDVVNNGRSPQGERG